MPRKTKTMPAGSMIAEKELADLAGEVYRNSASLYPPERDTAAMKDLILWCRKEQVAVTHATVGSVTLVLHDTRLTAASVERGVALNDADPQRGIYAEFGGSMLNPPSEATERNEPTIEDDDE